MELQALILYKNNIQHITRNNIPNYKPALILYKNNIQRYPKQLDNRIESLALILYKNNIQHI